MSHPPRAPVSESSPVQVLISAARIRRRIATLGQQLNQDFAGKDVVLVALLNGTVLFLADLIRHLNFPLRLDFLGVSSYGCGTESGDLIITKELRLELRHRHVLVLDDILDTGRTLRAVISRLERLQPASLTTCVLLDKPERRIGTLEANYVGFTIPNRFVVGYGLDYGERYRNLPFVGVLETTPPAS